MKCPNCDAVVSEGDEYCKECGYFLNDERKDTFDEAGSFIKNAIASPWKSIGHPYRQKTALILIGIMLIILSTVGVTQISGGLNDPWAGLEILFIVIPNFIILTVLFLIFYVTTVLFQGMVTKEIRGWKQVFTDYSKAMILLYLVYFVFALTITSLPDNVEMILWLIIYFLTISVPAFITVKYAGQGNAKFNILLSVLIYYVIINVPFFYVVFVLLVN